MNILKPGDMVRCVMNAGLQHAFPDGYVTRVLGVGPSFQNVGNPEGYDYIDVVGINGKVYGLREYRFAKVQS